MPHSIDAGSVPVVFADGTAIYDDLAKTYTRHAEGLFILAPSGTGKSYYVNAQSEKAWIDGDVLWVVTGADYSQDEWDESLEDIMEINGRSDVITQQAKKQGFWVLGSSNLFLQPDAIVIPEWDTHLSYISKRQSKDYDGGATTDDLEGLKSHINWITQKWKGTVPFFASIEDAVAHLKEGK
ncbi:MAG: hypothetical protein WA030_03655 [Candidatus Microsaccharimonas sp.]